MRKFTPKIDLTGQVFGKWTVLNYARNGQWLCKCTCGTEFKLNSDTLKKGYSTQCQKCAYLPKIDLSGNTFSKWTVKTYSKNGRWSCLCECGNESKVATSDLLKGHSKGCKMCALALPKGEAAFNELCGTYKRNANTRNLFFELQNDQMRDLFTDNCYYCGTVPIAVQKSRNGIFLYNGIDRINNNEGYTTDNCVTCCGICNRIKHILSEQDFLSHLKKIVEHRGFDA